MSDHLIAQSMVRRLVQLRLAIEGYFMERGVRCGISDSDGHGIIGGTWFEVGFVCYVEGHEIYLSMRAHQSRLKSKNPRDIVGWIEDDYTGLGLQAELSNNNDVIAYRSGTPRDIIDQIRNICNSVAVPY